MSYKEHKRHNIMLGKNTNETQQNREKLISKTWWQRVIVKVQWIIYMIFVADILWVSDYCSTAIQQVSAISCENNKR